VDITDAGGYYIGIEVETALQEVGASLAAMPPGSLAVLEGGSTHIRVGRVALNGVNPTLVNFQGDQVALYSGTVAAPWDLRGGLTIIANADGAGAETLTIPDTSGNAVGGAGGFGDISAQADDEFFINVNGLGPQLVSLTLASCTNGANTAAEMQTKIRALGGAPYNAVTVGFVEAVAGPPQLGTYTIISAATTGTGSTIRLTPSIGADVLNELGLAAPTYTDGLGAGANNAAVSAAELADWINATAVTFTAGAFPANHISIYGTVVGGSLVIGNGTANATIGFVHTDEAVGANGLGYVSNMANANYFVQATVIHGVAAEIAPIAVNNKTAGQFQLISETAARTYNVDLIIIGQIA